MYFEYSFVVVLIGSFELPPPVDVHGVLQLVFEGFDFGLLVEKILFFKTNLSLQLIDRSDLVLNAEEFVPFVGKISPEVVELLLFVFVINFALG